MRWSGNWHKLRALWARLRQATGGAAAVELAVITPIILVLLTGTIDLGAMATYGLGLDAAVRDAANFAMTCSYDDSSLNVNCTGESGYPGHATMCGIITGYTTNPCGSAATTIQVTFPNAQEAAGTANYPQACSWDNSPTTYFDCYQAATCSTTQSQCPMHTYITIKAVETLSPILEWVGMPTSITRTLTFRVS